MAFKAGGRVAYLTYQKQKQGAERNVRYGDRGGSGEERFQFGTGRRTYLEMCTFQTVRLCPSGFLEFLSKAVAHSNRKQEELRATLGESGSKARNSPMWR